MGDQTVEEIPMGFKKATIFFEVFFDDVNEEGGCWGRLVWWRCVGEWWGI